MCILKYMYVLLVLCYLFILIFYFVILFFINLSVIVLNLKFYDIDWVFLVFIMYDENKLKYL